MVIFYVEHGYIIFDMPVMRFWWVHIYRFFSIIIYIKVNEMTTTEIMIIVHGLVIKLNELSWDYSYGNLGEMTLKIIGIW